MKFMRNIIISLLILAILLTGCAQKIIQQEEEKTTETPEFEETGDESIDEVGSDISEIDTIDSELNASDLDDLEQELEELDW